MSISDQARFGNMQIAILEKNHCFWKSKWSSPPRTVKYWNGIHSISIFRWICTLKSQFPRTRLPLEHSFGWEPRNINTTVQYPIRIKRGLNKNSTPLQKKQITIYITTELGKLNSPFYLLGDLQTTGTPKKHCPLPSSLLNSLQFDLFFYICAPQLYI